MPQITVTKRKPSESLILFVAEGFGSGRFPIAPGTVGTLIGFAWIYVLLIPQNVWWYIAGIVAGFFAAVWLGGKAEEICGKKDPGSIVIDEITALPLALLGAVIANSKGVWTSPFPDYLGGKQIFVLVITFAGFRLFDVTKPWLIARAQNLPGGWGLVIDDFLAALPLLPVSYIAARFF